MAVPVVNIVIEKGVDFDATYTVTNDDNSVFSLSGQSGIVVIRYST